MEEMESHRDRSTFCGDTDSNQLKGRLDFRSRDSGSVLPLMNSMNGSYIQMCAGKFLRWYLILKRKNGFVPLHLCVH